MQIAKPVGVQAASRKYDILSALMAFGLASGRTTQTRVMRIMALITTRYNWQRDELSIGQREIARLWSVDERTVKREMAKLRTLGWLVQKRKGARGRISLYGLDLGRILDDTRQAWPLVGPDFALRMDPADTRRADNVVPLRVTVPAPAGQGAWTAAQAILYDEHPAAYAAWFHSMTEIEVAEGLMILSVTSTFHATYVETHYWSLLMSAVRRVDPAITRVQLVI